MVAAVLSPLAKLLLKKGYKKGAGLFQGLNVRAPFKGKEVSEVVRRGPKFNKQIENTCFTYFRGGDHEPKSFTFLAMLGPCWHFWGLLGPSWALPWKPPLLN